jgi:hypothetical protein
VESPFVVCQLSTIIQKGPDVNEKDRRFTLRHPIPVLRSRHMEAFKEKYDPEARGFDFDRVTSRPV